MDSLIPDIGYGGGQDEEFPFAVTTRINANMQQFLIEYEREENHPNRECVSNTI